MMIAALIGLQPLLAQRSVIFRGSISHTPALRWEDGFVSGNGRMGAILYGTPESETLIANHCRLFLPLGNREIVPDLARYVPELRETIRSKGWPAGLDFYLNKAKSQGFPGLIPTDPYHPAFFIQIKQKSIGEISGYERTENFQNGEIIERWRDSRGEFCRKMFASRTDNVIVFSQTGPAPCELDFPPVSEKLISSEMIKTPDWVTYHNVYTKGKGGYDSAIRIIRKNNGCDVTLIIRTVPWKTPLSNEISDAWAYSADNPDFRTPGVYKPVPALAESSVVAYLKTDDSKALMPQLKASMTDIPAEYAGLLTPHAAVHGELFNRVALDLNGGPDRQATTEELLNEAQKEKRLPAALMEKMYDAGRYMYICSAGELLPNLVGIWTGSWSPEWSGDFTLDTNVQSAMASACSANLTDLMEGYFRLIESFYPEWSLNAKRIYGCRGYLSNARASNTCLLLHWGHWPGVFWTAGSGWLASFFYEYAVYSGDKEFLRNRCVPLLKEIAAFYKDFLTEKDKDGFSTFIPSYNPETEGNGIVNATMDIAVAREVLGNLITACRELGIEQQNIPGWENQLAKLPHYPVNSIGELTEFPEGTVDAGHRHHSQLYPCFQSFDPLFQTDPVLRKAAQTSVRVKIAGSDADGEQSSFGRIQAGVSAAWLGMPEEAYGRLKVMAVKRSMNANLITSHEPGARIFNTDGNGGIPQIVNTMLLISRQGQLDLLPALPDAWPAGSVKGILARGAFQVDLKWENHTLTEASVASKLGGPCKVNYAGKTIEFPTQKGKTYRIKFEGNNGFSQVSVHSGKNIDLAGVWQFAADSLAIGEREHWEKGSLKGTIRLPGSTDEIGLGNCYPMFVSALGKNDLPDYPVNADFGMLTRLHKFIGVAWYQKEIDIPANLAGQHFSLSLERVMWRSKIWVDGKLVGNPIDFLSSPHVHDLGFLTSGKHIITMMIDNRLIYPVGTLAHSYCPHMQTQWNGAVGKIEMNASPSVSMENIVVTPSFARKQVVVDFQLINRLADNQTISLEVDVKEQISETSIAHQEVKIVVQPGESLHKLSFQLKDVKPWDEFTPNLYEVAAILTNKNHSQSNISTFGFRDLGTTDKHITINGRKILIRNSHEGMFFGKTGYPAMDVAYWKNVFGLYKQHGLNAVRFHSACPPEEAFVAADELGIYLQVEFFWMDGWMGLKDLIGNRNDTLNQFVLAEMQQALKTYGNHPSMVFVSFGNELGGNFDQMGEWIAAIKKDDGRHFYAAGISHNITTADDFVEYGGKGLALKMDGTDWDYTSNYQVPSMHNYDAAYRREKLPEFSHETGQYIVHPLWSEIDKYNGVLSPRNLLYFKDIAKKNGIENLDYQFQQASGNINRIFYKAEIEATLRTPLSAGFGLLSMVDYPGQGEALVGWVDPFYENKNFLTPMAFKSYGNHTVPLLRFQKFVWEDGEKITGKVEVSNFGPETLKQKEVHYTIRKEGRILLDRKFPPADIVQGGVTEIGEFQQVLESGVNGRKLTLTLSIPGTSFSNSWDIWVFPVAESMAKPDNILITGNIDSALVRLNAGGKVLLTADKLGPLKNRTYAAFSPVFWSATWFSGQPTQVSGAVVQNNHPAMKLFPTSEATDWQWKEVCQGARGFILNDLPKSYLPIVQPVNDYHYGNKLGTIFEFRSSSGGKMLVCGYNISEGLDKRPAARQLRISLLSYMASSDFKPGLAADQNWLRSAFADLYVPLKKEKGFESSCLYVSAGYNEPDPGSADWSPEMDESIADPGFEYKVNCEGVWRDDKGSYWFGRKMKIEIGIKNPALMELKICFLDPNKLNRKGIINCEDMPGISLGNHQKETWITIPVTRENCLDGKINVTVNCTSGPNLMITKLALIK